MPPVPPPQLEERNRQQSAERALRREQLLGSIGRVLDDAVKELQQQGTTVISMPPATLSARVVRFHWGDSVLEIDGRSGNGAGVTTGSRTRLGRQDEETQAEILKRYLASALTDLSSHP